MLSMDLHACIYVHPSYDAPIQELGVEVKSSCFIANVETLTGGRSLGYI